MLNLLSFFFEFEFQFYVLCKLFMLSIFEICDKYD
jgi:hypothetical protein